MLTHGITDEDQELLCLYNDEVSRGVMHTDKWHTKMRKLQNTWDSEYWKTKDWKQVGPFYIVK